MRSLLDKELKLMIDMTKLTERTRIVNLLIDAIIKNYNLNQVLNLINEQEK